MAPNKLFRTYSRGNSSVSCVDAFNILFAKNLTERKLYGKVNKGKGKLKFEIKELPTRIKTVLNDESSLRVNINDTFDNLLKDPSQIIECDNVKVSKVAKKSSFSVVKHLSSIDNVSSNVSYNISRKLRSHSHKNTTEKTYDSWFNQPTPSEEEITNMLEIEKIKPGWKKANRSNKTSRTERTSPILLRSQVQTSYPKIIIEDTSTVTKCSVKCNDFSNESKINGKGKSTTISHSNFHFDPIFTNSVREQILIHSSTPVTMSKKQPLVRQPISPIDNQDKITNIIVESLGIIKSWNSLPPEFEHLDKKDNNKSQTSQNSEILPLKTLSFDLEHFELIFEELKMKSLQSERGDSNFKGKFITEDDFESFHKKLIDSQRGDQGQLIKSISLKEFESFYEMYQKNISFSKESFFDSCHRSVNFVTHRKHKKSHNPSRLSQKFNLKDLYVVLDNNLLNCSISKFKKHNSGCALKNSINEKQLTVKLTRLSLDKLKLRLNQSQSLFKAKHNVKFKACRKFSSNCSTEGVSKLLPNSKAHVSIKNTISDLAGKSNMKSRTTKCFGNVANNKTKFLTKLSRSCYSDHRKDVQLAIGEDNNIMTGKENEVSSRIHSGWSKQVRKSCPAILNSFSFNSLENERKQLFSYADLPKSAVRITANTEKQYVAKILVASTSDTSTEIQEPHGSSNSPTWSAVNNRRLRSCMRSYGDDHPKIKEPQHTSILKHQNITKTTPVCQSNIAVEYFAQDLSDSILLRANTSLATSEASPLEVNSSLESTKSLRSCKSHCNAKSIKEYAPNTPPANFEASPLVNSSLESTKSLRSCRRYYNAKSIKEYTPNTSPGTFEASPIVNSSLESAKSSRRCKSHYNAKSIKEYTSNTPPAISEASPVRSNAPNTPPVTSETSPVVDLSLESTQSYYNAKLIKKNIPFVQHKDNSFGTTFRDRLDQNEDSPFKVPMTNYFGQKPPNLRAGKLWRRSLMQHKRESVIDLTRDSCGDSSFQFKLSESRQSAKILLSEETNRLRRKTALQLYVCSGLVLNDSFDDSNIRTSRNLTLEKPYSSITAREMVLQYCKQTDPVAFEKIYPKSLLKDCKKIGEGLYGEVFLYSHENGNTSVMKVIPIEGDKKVNGERQKMFPEILSEVAIVSQLSNLRRNASNKTSAFCEVQKISCVQGKYPKFLLDLWYAYDKIKASENDPPDYFDKDQLYIVLDLANGGRDLEAFIFNNASQAIAMFKQVAYALAIGEEHLQFEHRDLHWGNILLDTVDKNKKEVFKHKGKIKECNTQGVKVTVIDFTLSRISHDGVIIFNDLAMDPELFLAEGDYQYDIYRLMQQKNNNDWKKFTPYTNILWLHYILRKSITGLRYKNTKTKIHQKSICELKKYENNILNFDCASEFVDECLK